MLDLTEAEVRQLVEIWYARLDVHPPVEEILPMLADEQLTMQLPETTLHGQADFRKWYEGVTHKFFNEVHVLKEVDMRIEAKQADIYLIVNWQAYTWQAPAAKVNGLASMPLSVGSWSVQRKRNSLLLSPI